MCTLLVFLGQVVPATKGNASAISVVHAGFDELVRALEHPDSTLVLFGALLLAIFLIGRGFTEYVNETQATVAVLERFGRRFVREFEQPLILQPRDGSPLEARLRVKPAQRRLHILLAPAGGRRYPNLTDHRKNVEYDVQRVVQLLGDEAFVSDPLQAQGKWVVVPFHLRTDSRKAV